MAKPRAGDQPQLAEEKSAPAPDPADDELEDELDLDDVQQVEEIVEELICQKFGVSMADLPD